MLQAAVRGAGRGDDLVDLDAGATSRSTNPPGYDDEVRQVTGLLSILRGQPPPELD